MEGKEDRNCDEGLLKRDRKRIRRLEKRSNGRNWRLLIENAERESEMKKDNETENMANPPVTLEMPRKQQQQLNTI